MASSSLGAPQHMQAMMDLGFSRELSSKALANADGDGVRGAVQWLFAHRDEEIAAANMGDVHDTAALEARIADAADAKACAAIFSEIVGYMEADLGYNPFDVSSGGGGGGGGEPSEALFPETLDALQKSLVGAAREKKVSLADAWTKEVATTFGGCLKAVKARRERSAEALEALEEKRAADEQKGSSPDGFGTFQVSSGDYLKIVDGGQKIEGYEHLATLSPVPLEAGTGKHTVHLYADTEHFFYGVLDADTPIHGCNYSTCQKAGAWVIEMCRKQYVTRTNGKGSWLTPQPGGPEFEMNKQKVSMTIDMDEKTVTYRKYGSDAPEGGGPKEWTVGGFPDRVMPVVCVFGRGSCVSHGIGDA